jgi:hypothetical protein
MDPGYLSRVLSGKLRLPVRRLPRVIKALQMEDKKRDWLVLQAHILSSSTVVIEYIEELERGSRTRQRKS